MLGGRPFRKDVQAPPAVVENGNIPVPVPEKIGDPGIGGHKRHPVPSGKGQEAFQGKALPRRRGESGSGR
ncbi:hypothetical protein SDC9_165539 [bioreactor metagenome]|uniref:Uncharacterized protein n=1 Tax=bioreactor metagenome TaxID=1076179 RepID=A0A645FUK7_9ZZZZ